MEKKTFFFYHNNVHRITSYNHIKNENNKTRQHWKQNVLKRYTTYCKFCTQIERKIHIKNIKHKKHKKYLILNKELRKDKNNR